MLYSKIRGSLALAASDRLKKRYEADALWVKVVVEGGEQRLHNLLNVAEQAAGERAHHFWFTTTDLIDQHNLLSDRIWHVAGKPGRQFAVT